MMIRSLEPLGRSLSSAVVDFCPDTGYGFEPEKSMSETRSSYLDLGPGCKELSKRRLQLDVDFEGTKQ